MITWKLQIILGIILSIILIAVIGMIKRKSIDLKYALSWLAVIITLFILDCFPEIMLFLSSLLGITMPVNMVFFLGFCFFMMIIFTLTVALSRLSLKNKSLAQEIALLNKKVDDMNGQDN